MLGDYRVLHTVGSGGMGVVYAVWDTRLDRRVALKMVHRHLLANPDVTRRFLREARAAARVEHPNVVRVYRVESIDGEPAIEMQYIEGTSLSLLLRAAPLPAGQAADLLHQVLSALAACHAQSVIHCDLKPSNLLLDPDGTIYLTDFGISRALQLSSGDQDGGTLTTGPGWGTPHYSPPEAWNGEHPAASWDLYALGVMVYEALAGHSAFHAHTPAGLMNQILNTAPESLHQLRPDLSEAFVALIHDLMARDPGQRPANATAALNRLHTTSEFEVYQAETQPLRPRDALERSEQPTRPRRRAGRLWFAAAIPLVVLISAYFILQGDLRKGELPSPESVTQPAAAGGIGPGSAATVHEPVQSGPPEPSEITGNNEGAYFTYDDGIHGRELWFISHDGKAELVRDIVQGPGSSKPRHLFQRSDEYNLIFSATTPEHGEELWLCRKTGLHDFDVLLIKDIIPGEMGSEPQAFEHLENVYFFYATTLHEGRELWLTTSREAQTAMVEDLYPGAAGSTTMNPNVAINTGGLYFLGIRGADYGQELFYYDHATLKIHHISDVYDGAGAMALAGKALIIANKDDAHGVEPWTVRAGTRGIKLLTDIAPGPESSNPDQIFSWHGHVYFNAWTKETGVELWKSDGTPGGTALLADIDPGEANSSPFAFVAGAQFLYFRATTAATGNELWRTDGTPGGTQMVVDAWPGPESGGPYNVVMRDNTLLFTANDGQHGEELWCADPGLGKPPQMVADLWPGPTGAEPHNLAATTPNRGVLAFKSEKSGPSLGVVDWHEWPVRIQTVQLPQAGASDLGQNP